MAVSLNVLLVTWTFATNVCLKGYVINAGETNKTSQRKENRASLIITEPGDILSTLVSLTFHLIIHLTLHYFTDLDQIDATNAPKIANDTMPADGTTAAAAPKCPRATTYATVGDLESTSTTNVRFDVSSILNKFAKTRATAPPIIGSNTEHATAGFHIVEAKSESAELAAPPAHRIIMATIPSFAVGSFLDIPGNSPLKAMPAQSGAKTSLAVDINTAIPFMGMLLPNSNPTTNGVATTPRMVVDNVHTTDRETLPPASSAKRLDACPPPTDPKMIVPAATCGLQLRKFRVIATANSGIITKQQIALRSNTPRR